VLVVALAGVAAVSAAASPPGTNGQIAFARFNPTLGDTQVYVVNRTAVGSGSSRGRPTSARVRSGFPTAPTSPPAATSPAAARGSSTPTTEPSATSTDSTPGLFNPCGSPSPDGTLLHCVTFSDDGSQNGIHTIRSSDGGGLTQITSNPGGDDVPGSWSPNGKRIVFQRISPTGDYEASSS
jgi:WD40-like Beta Propeller Repeat